ncbi:YhcN/YlaJ family sporulation lipoprotein [Ectobacillus funiculus]|uniref:YhcN/YlaJ family sporulation lipoprotein n=1 Tax=Ectobacillus funiculus TaxID=137993 RepID=A0ABV5WKF6_9BACI
MRGVIITKFFFSILLFAVIVGCGNEQKKETAKNEPRLTTVSSDSFNQLPSQNAEKQIVSLEEVTAAKAVNSDKELYVAATPQHHERFQLDRLKKKMKQKMNDVYPNLKSYISVDKKIFMEIKQLKNDIKRGKADKKTIEKKLKKIKLDMNSDT